MQLTFSAECSVDNLATVLDQLRGQYVQVEGAGRPPLCGRVHSAGPSTDGHYRYVLRLTDTWSPRGCKVCEERTRGTLLRLVDLTEETVITYL